MPNSPHQKDWAKKTNREGKKQWESFLFSQAATTAAQFPLTRLWPREGSAHIRLEPAMPHQIFQCSKGVKTQGKRLTTGENLTAFQLKLELKTERIQIKLFLAVAIGTHYLRLKPHLRTGEQVRPSECSDGKTATEIELLKEMSLVIGNDVSTTLAPSQWPSLIQELYLGKYKLLKEASNRYPKLL